VVRCAERVGIGGSWRADRDREAGQVPSVDHQTGLAGARREGLRVGDHAWVEAHGDTIHRRSPVVGDGDSAHCGGDAVWRACVSWVATARRFRDDTVLCGSRVRRWSISPPPRSPDRRL